MRCPFCGDVKDRVVDSREGRGGDTIRRRRECLACRKRFTSYERIEDIPFMVVKRDGKREIFDGNKLLAGLIKSVEKRPVSMTELEDVVSDVVSLLHDANNRELEAERIGEVVMAALRDLDQVAYVRFASVYRRFEDVSEFMEELKGLVERKSRKTGDRGPV
jgi:transcriptional repressor NrdR